MIHLYSCSSKVNIVSVNVECKKCDFSILTQAAEQEDYKPDFIDEIFCTIDTICFRNVEFAEFSNEILFEALNKSPNAFIKILQNQNLKKKELVLNELENPVSDAIDLDKIISKIMRQKNELSSELISRLEKAKSKY